jgi:predicted nucleic-acid-binding protein
VGREAVKITADTNVLVRVLVEDDPRQSKAAQTALRKADVISTSALCEVAWVLSQGYKIHPTDIAESLRRLLNGAVVANRPRYRCRPRDAGRWRRFHRRRYCLRGSWLGAETFVSFDKRAVKLLQAQGKAARLLS